MSDDTYNSSLLGFEYQGVIDQPSGKLIGFKSTLSKNCKQEELDSLLDKCRKAITRQQLFAKLDVAIAGLRSIEEGLILSERELAISDSKAAKRAEEHTGRAGRELSSSEAKARQDKVVALETSHRNRANLLVKIEALRTAIGEESNSVFGLGNGKEEGASSPFLG